MKRENGLRSTGTANRLGHPRGDPILSSWIWEVGDELLTTHGGLGVVGALFQDLLVGDRLNTSAVPTMEHPEISHRDVVAAYVGVLAQGKNDCDHIEALRADPFFAHAFGLFAVPSSPTLPQAGPVTCLRVNRAAWTRHAPAYERRCRLMTPDTSDPQSVCRVCGQALDPRR